jgi:L-fucose mutarotase/ribose pyranase (RbsD/FucU family)
MRENAVRFRERAAQMTGSEKTKVWEHLFYWRYAEDGTKSPRWDEVAQTIPEDKRLVYSFEVAKAIAETNADLSHNQPASFAKDYLRYASRDDYWPPDLSAKRWTAEQVTGRDPATKELRNFAFLPWGDGQTEPFPDPWRIPDEYPSHAVQSVTLSIASKQITRMDEARLMQIAIDLRVVETHFALYSPLSKPQYSVVHMDHLQMALKLRVAEIDGLYRADFLDQRRQLHSVLITVETKKHNEFITSSQVLRQVLAASGLGVAAELIVPLALKHGDGGMFIFEYAPFVFDGTPFKPNFEKTHELERVAAVFYAIEPPVVGLSQKAKRLSTP